MNRRTFLTASASASASALLLSGLTSSSSPPQPIAAVPPPQAPSTKGLYIVWQGALQCINHQTGEVRKLSDENWSATSFMTALGGKLYAINANLLYMINPDGTYRKLSSDSWIGTAFLYGSGSSLYAISQAKLYRINPADGSFKEIPTKTLEFIGVKNLVWCAGTMYCIAGTLCTLDLQTGAVSSVSKDNWGASAAEVFTALGSTLYIINDGTLYSINPTNGSYKAVSDDDWSSAKKLLSLDGRLYIYADSALYSIDPQTGAFTNVGNRRTLKNAYCITPLEG